MTSKESRKESSVPVASRVSLIDLARLDLFWLREENIQMKTMSQLVSWSITALCEALMRQGKIPKGIDNVIDANNYLVSRGIYQQGMKKKAQARIATAIRFEGFRQQGIDPKTTDKFDGQLRKDYNIIHGNERSRKYNPDKTVNVYDGHLKVEEQQSSTGIDWDEVEMEKKAAEKREMREGIAKAIASGRASDCIMKEDEVIEPKPEHVSGIKEGELDKLSEEEFVEKQRKKDEARIAAENAPVDVSQMKLAKE